MLLSDLGGERQSAEDIARCYLRTYILVKVEGQEKVALVSLVRRETISLQFHGEDFPRLFRWEDVDILFIIPESGVYQLEDGVAVIRRIPLRQWKKGMSSENLSVHTYHAGGRCHVYQPHEDRETNTIPFEVAGKLFTKQNDQLFTDAVGMVEATNIPQRVCNKFWVKPEKGRTALFHNRIRMGSWDMNKFFWSPNARILHEELRDHLNLDA